MKIIHPKSDQSIDILIDDDCYEELSQKTWHISSHGYAASRYGYGRKNSKIRYMHRIVTGCPDGLVVDHINGNRLDNRKENLRCVSIRENSMNRISDVRGFFFDRSRGKFRVEANGRYVGRYDTEDEARKAYESAKSDDSVQL